MEESYEIATVGGLLQLNLQIKLQDDVFVACDR